MTNYIGDWLLDIVSIATNRSADEFAREQIEAIAHAIVSLRGVINPLIVRKVGYNADGEEQYELVDGHLQYFAAKRAMEIDPKLEMIRAFVIENGQETLFQRQIELLRSPDTVPSPRLVSDQGSFDYQRLRNELESLLNGKLGELARTIRSELTNFKGELISLVNLLTAQKQTTPKKGRETAEKPTIPNKSQQTKGKITAQEFIDLVNNLSEQELYDKLGSYRNSDKFLPDLLKHRSFTSIKDIIEKVPQFTRNTRDTIRLNWHG